MNLKQKSQVLGSLVVVDCFLNFWFRWPRNQGPLTCSQAFPAMGKRITPMKPRSKKKRRGRWQKFRKFLDNMIRPSPFSFMNLTRDFCSPTFWWYISGKIRRFPICEDSWSYFSFFRLEVLRLFVKNSLVPSHQELNHSCPSRIIPKPMAFDSGQWFLVGLAFGLRECSSQLVS